MARLLISDECQNYRRGDATLIEGFDTFGDWTSYGGGDSSIEAGTVTEDETGGEYLGAGSSGSLRLVAASATAPKAWKTFTAPVDISDMEYFSMWISIDSLTGGESIRIFFSDLAVAPASWSKFIHVWPASIQAVKVGHKYHLSWRASNFAEGGAAVDRTNIQTMAVIFYTTGAGGITFDNLKGRASPPRAKFILNVQRGYTATQSLLLPLCSDASLDAPIVGTISVAGSVVGTGGYMSLAQLQSAKAAGWVMTNRSYTGLSQTGKTTQQVADDYTAGKQYLIDNALSDGLSANFTTYPAIYYDATVRAGVEQAGMILATIPDQMGVPSATYPYDRMQPHTEGLAEPLYLNEWGLNKDEAVSTYTSDIDNTIRQGSTYILYVHGLTDTPTDPADYDPDDFLLILQHLDMRRSQGLIDIVTFSEWYQGLTSPRVVCQP